MSANTGGPAFPEHTAGLFGQHVTKTSGMTMLDWFAGQETLSDFDHPDEQMPVNGAVALAGPQPDREAEWQAHFAWNAKWRAKLKWMRAEAMLAEKQRREGGAA